MKAFPLTKHFKNGRLSSMWGDVDSAVTRYREGAESGDPRCMMALAGQLSNEGSKHHNPDEAEQLVKRAAEAEYPEAFEVLGDWYKNGFGSVQKDTSKAIRFLQMASDRGLPEAKRILALIYLDNDDIHLDIKAGVQLLRESAMLGLPPAFYTYALVLWDGIDGKADRVEAGAWMTLAAEFDINDSRDRLEMVGLGKSKRLVPKIAWRKKVARRVEEIKRTVTPYVAHKEDDELYEESSRLGQGN